MKAGQTSITLDGANITFACPGTWSVKGAGQGWDSGASLAADLGKLPNSLYKLFDEQFQLRDPNGKPLEGVPYSVEGASAHDVSHTPADGKTQRLGGDSSEDLKFALRWFTFKK